MFINKSGYLCFKWGDMMERLIDTYEQRQREINRALNQWIWSFLCLVIVKNTLWLLLGSHLYLNNAPVWIHVSLALVLSIVCSYSVQKNYLMAGHYMTAVYFVGLSWLDFNFISHQGSFLLVGILLASGLTYIKIESFYKKHLSCDVIMAQMNDAYIEATLKAAQLNNDLAGMYEELEANDEELRAQYQELQEHRDHLMLVQKRNTLLFKASSEVIWELDLVTGVRHFAEENFVDEVALDLIQSPNFEDWAYDLHPEDKEFFAISMRRVMSGEKTYDDFEIRVNDLKGGWKWLRSKVVSLCDDSGKPIMMAGSYADIDDRKKKEERIHYLAYHDQLTGLANRLNMLEHIQEALGRKIGAKACSGVFLYIDLDDFGAINNTYGHDTGDLLIVEVAKRLVKARPMDVIARFGGADFGIYCGELQYCEAPGALAEMIRHLLRAPYEVDSKTIYLTASVGVSVISPATVRAESVLRHGDIALREAKKLGKDRIRVYAKRMSNEVSQRLLMVNELRLALDRQEFYMNFQPQIDLQPKTLHGFEALLRWNSRTYGIVGPDKFIPLLEETGLIIPVGQWVIEQSCLFIKRVNELLKDRQVTVSINVAAQQLEDESFIDKVKQAIDNANINASALCIEITESSVIQSLSQVTEQLESLREMDIKVALDDFGTGFSSLNYLNELPIDILKIDKSFTRKITLLSKEFSLVKAVSNLAAELGLKIVIEGVEEEIQLDVIRQLSQVIIQGYYFGRPMSEQIALAFAANQKFN